MDSKTKRQSSRFNSRALLRAGRVGSIAGLGLLALYFALSYQIVLASLTPHPLACETRNLPPMAEEVRFASAGDGIELVGWILPPKVRSPKPAVIILVHGIDSRSWDGDQPDIALAYHNAGFAVFSFDLRAHGKSAGGRVGLGWDERGDVRAAADLLRNRGFLAGNIGIHGTSYGAATALLGAAITPEIGAVVADSAFSDIRDLIDREIEARTGMPKWIIGSTLRPGIRAVAKLAFALDLNAIAPVKLVAMIAPRPILFIHGAEDQTTPAAHSQRLFDASAYRENQIWLIPELGHTEAVRLMAPPCQPRAISPYREVYLERVVHFFKRALSAKSQEESLSSS